VARGFLLSLFSWRLLCSSRDTMNRMPNNYAMHTKQNCSWVRTMP
jgi:hypothetical protein